MSAGVVPAVVPVRTICSWCGGLISDGPLVDGKVSHGIHPSCAAGVRQWPDLQLRPARERDVVFDLAAALGYRAMCAEGEALASFASWKAGLRVAYDHLLKNDRRGR